MTNPEAMAKGDRQKMEETPMEKKSRTQSGFPDIEKKMPALASRRKAGLVDTLSSMLGTKNPLSHAVNPAKDELWLFDNTAWRGRGGKWNAEVVAAYFLKDSGDDKSEVVASISEILGLAKDDEARDTIAERLAPFLDSVLPAHTVKINIDGKQVRLGPSDIDGISTDVVQFSGKHANGSTVSPTAVGIKSATPMHTFFAEPDGWAVISDVDDTIKRTMTASPIGILQTTFVEDPQPIKGMPDFYQHMNKVLATPPFWYLSASPYNLYSFIRSFKDAANYPPGQLILRDASWMNLAGLLASVSQGTQAYKVDRMEKVHGWFPARNFITIGDSTQSDPEAYGEMYRRHPTWIRAIFIRKVTGVAAAEMDEEGKNKPERFAKAFKGVPADVWHVFEQPDELYERVDKLVAAGLK
jgi:phosphatidate phosphatase APP1